MAPKIKSEKGSYTLEEGKGTVLVIRVMADGQSYGNIQEFPYNGNSTQAIVQAIQMARGEIDIDMARAAAAAAAAKVAPAKPVPAPKPKQESADESEGSDESEETGEAEGSDDETEEPAAEGGWQQSSLL